MCRLMSQLITARSNLATILSKMQPSGPSASWQIPAMKNISLQWTLTSKLFIILIYYRIFYGDIWGAIAIIHCHSIYYFLNTTSPPADLTSSILSCSNNMCIGITGPHDGIHVFVLLTFLVLAIECAKSCVALDGYKFICMTLKISLTYRASSLLISEQHMICCHSYCHKGYHSPHNETVVLLLFPSNRSHIPESKAIVILWNYRSFSHFSV